MINQVKEQSEIRLKAQQNKRKYLIDGIFKNENVGSKRKRTAYNPEKMNLYIIIKLKLYGPKGVFYKLSTKCFKINRTEFTYEVCPYKRVTQFKLYNMGRKTNIGIDSTLVLGEISNRKVWILKMGNGNREFCSKPRESEVNIITIPQDYFSLFL